MKDINNHRWRKASDIDKEHAIYELMVDDVSILDVSHSDSETFEISFNEGIFGVAISWLRFQEIIEEGRLIAQADLPPEG